MKRLLVAITVALTLVASYASAFDPEDLKKLEETNNCEDCDLSEADLREIFSWSAQESLRGADLSYANMSGTLMVGIKLDRANLTRANISRANASGVPFKKANLSGANLRGANLFMADLTGANLSGANIDAVLFCYTIMPDGSTNMSGC